MVAAARALGTWDAAEAARAPGTWDVVAAARAPGAWVHKVWRGEAAGLPCCEMSAFEMGA